MNELAYRSFFSNPRTLGIGVTKPCGPALWNNNRWPRWLGDLVSVMAQLAIGLVNFVPSVTLTSAPLFSSTRPGTPGNIA